MAAAGFFDGFEELLPKLDEAKRRHPGADMRRHTIKHIISSLAVLDPDDPIKLLNDMLDTPSAMVTKSWMNSRMSPALSTGKRTGDGWYGTVPSYFPTSHFAEAGASSPTKPTAIMDSRTRQIHELRPAHLDGASRRKLFTSRASANVEKRLNRLLKRERGSTPRLSARGGGGAGSGVSAEEALISAVAPAVAEEYALLMMESAMEACMAQAVKSSGGFEDMFAAGFATDDAAFVGGGGLGDTSEFTAAYQFEGELMCVLGGPGSGKTTHCKAIAAERGCTHIHLGHKIRERIARGAPNADYLREVVAAGHLVDDVQVFEMLRDALQEETAAGSPGPFLLDGFPRNVRQAERLVKEFGTPHSVLLLDCHEDVMAKRVLARGESSGRLDDNQATLETLFKEFAEDIMPVVDYFDGKTCVHRVDAAVAPPAVTANMQTTIAASILSTSLVASVIQETLEDLVGLGA